jgi:hypothetical protein
MANNIIVTKLHSALTSAAIKGGGVRQEMLKSEYFNLTGFGKKAS